MIALEASRLKPLDTLRLGTRGLRLRPVRAALSSLGIAIGIAAAVAVLGISTSAQAGLLARLGAEANLLTVASGQSIDGQPAPLPSTSVGMVGRIGPVQDVAAVGHLPGVSVRRSATIPTIDTGGIVVMAADLNLLNTVGARVAHGAYLNRATAAYPAVILGFAAARTLGLAEVSPGVQVFLGRRYFTVVGILRPVAVAPEIDDAALIGFPEAVSEMGMTGRPSRIYLRVDPDQVETVAKVLPFTVNPQQPEAVRVSRPSDLLVARSQTRTAFAGLFLGLGAIGILLGTVGIANVMVISVLERRTEIGLRRALGATRPQVAGQFLTEALALSGLGGVGGVAAGMLATAIYVVYTGQVLAIPPAALVVGPLAALLAGGLAGVYPAVRAARLAPTEALRAG